MKKKCDNLNDPISFLAGVGARVEEQLKRLNIHTVKDILFHLPYRYIDRTRLYPIGSLSAGQYAYVQGKIELSELQYGKRRSLLCRISDETGIIYLRFFHFSRSQQRALAPDKIVRCYGLVRYGARYLEIVHPECHIINSEDDPELEQHLTPVYPLTEGLGQGKLRSLAKQALNLLDNVEKREIELLPKACLQRLDMIDLSVALDYIHRPSLGVDTDVLKQGKDRAQQRLSFEELLAHQLSLKLARQQYRSRQAPVFAADTLISKFLAKLPFTLTQAQRRVHSAIGSDLRKNVPMLRLLQGDVGSGKTVVAVLAALQAIDSGYQAAIMVPTELLVEQHYNTLTNWFVSLAVPVIALSGRLSKKEYAKQCACLAAPKPLLVIGTHALFQEKVRFGKLGLVIIDEQHRFGVDQRLTLLEKGDRHGFLPHQLVMTATPIPRTLTMIAYADLSVSIIDELPPSRRPVNTVIMSNRRRDAIIERIAHTCLKKRQCYWICTLIEESRSGSYQAAIDTHQALQERLPAQTVGLVHGRMDSEKKRREMDRFKLGELDILVATTVIEVGVDVPNASLMVIENAERLGLAQLHQLRGRIGRGTVNSDCVLIYQAPLSEHARQRLATIRNTSDGFKIAEKDLELRGPGELLGRRQTGLPGLKIADLIRDRELLNHVHLAADMLFTYYPQCIMPLIQRWLGQSIEYGNV